jgi:hypothetical protein
VSDNQHWVPDLVIYHDKCADGLGAAWAVWKWLGDAPRYVASNYGLAPPDVLDKHVLIVDFSFPRDVLNELVYEGGARSVVVLDHHKTAAADLEPFRFNESSPGAIGYFDVAGMLRDLDELARPPIIAIFDMERSGARMAWDFGMGSPPPRLIELIEDRDLWRFRFGDASRHLHLTLQSEAIGTVHQIQRLDEIAAELAAGNGPLERGAAIGAWRDQLVAEIAERAYFGQIGDHTPVMVECPYGLVSDVGHLLLNRYPHAPFAALRVSGEHSVTFSLRSSDEREDVGAVAKRFGGGGHRNAAGFKVPA